MPRSHQVFAEGRGGREKLRHFGATDTHTRVRRDLRGRLDAPGQDHRGARQGEFGG